MRELSGKLIWLTGASSGIGEALAYELAKKGAKLILSARNTSELNRVRSSCAAPETHHVVPLDLEQYLGLEGLANEIWAHHGKIDILINNAGVSQRYLALESSIGLDEKIMAVNFFGTVALTRPLLRKMVGKGVGHIVTVSSVLGLYGVQTRTTYAASKHALRGYFNSLRNEIFGTGVVITNIYPGYVTTKVSENALTATGSMHGKMDEGHSKGMSARDCAKRIVLAIERDEDEVVVAKGKELLGVYLSRFFPGLFRWVSVRSRV